MNELRALLLKEENYLVLARDLSEAMYEARAHLVYELWKAIENAMQGIKGFPSKSDEESRVSLDKVSGYVKSSRNYSQLGLSYPSVPPGTAFGSNDARLCAEVLGYMDQITIGLKFIGEKDDDDKQVEGLLGKLRSSSIKVNVERHEKDTWLWWQCINNGWGLRNPKADHLRTLLCEDKRKKVERCRKRPEGSLGRDKRLGYPAAAHPNRPASGTLRQQLDRGDDQPAHREHRQQQAVHAALDQGLQAGDVGLGGDAFRDGIADDDDGRFGLAFVEAGVPQPLGGGIGVEGGDGHGDSSPKAATAAVTPAG